MELLFLLVVSLMFVPSVASSEGEIIEAQQRLNAKAAEASKSGDYQKAAELLQASLELGEFNIIYLNLGRVLQKDDRCEPAREAYQSALTAPAAPGVPVDQIHAAVERYQQELGRACRARLVVRCQPAGVSLRLDDGAELACGVPIMLASGAYRLQATFGMDVQTQDVVLEDRDDRALDVVFAVDGVTPTQDVGDGGDLPGDTGTAPLEREPTQGGWTTQDTVVVAVGALALAGIAAGIHFHSSASDDVALVGEVVRSETPYRDDYDFLVGEIQRKEAWMWGSFGAGGVLGVLSLALFLVDFEEPANATLGVGGSEEGWRVRFETRF